MTTAHRFPIASVTKTFVATVVLQLVAVGRLELDAPAGEHGASVRQLLNHTSGLPDAWDIEDLLEPYRRDLAHRPVRARGERGRARPRPPPSVPTRRRLVYSGGNYAVLGLLVEEPTGSTLQDELALRILEPLRLTATELLDSLPDDVAHAYLPPDNPVLPGPGPGPGPGLVLFTTHPLDEDAWNAMARIAWASYCGNPT